MRDPHRNSTSPYSSSSENLRESQDFSHLSPSKLMSGGGGMSSLRVGTDGMFADTNTQLPLLAQQDKYTRFRFDSLDPEAKKQAMQKQLAQQLQRSVDLLFFFFSSSFSFLFS
jgi:hypothetical protein